MPKPSDLPKTTGAWRFQPVTVAGRRLLPVSVTQIERAALDERLNRTTHAEKETHNSDRTD